MSSVHQSDYSGENTLVPSSLVVFRHFQAHVESGLLAPMSWQPREWHHVQSMRAYNPSGIVWPDGPPTPETYHAGCKRLETPQALGHEVKPHAAPDKDCQCGFYASYDPATDFYPMWSWGLEWTRMTGQAKRQNTVVVRAVCEVSGKVVMGRLGVRAEKIKILAIAPDWSKHVLPESVETWGGFHYHSDVGTTNEQETDTVLELTKLIAHRYGAKHYDEPEDMHDDHPKADIEALGVDTTPRPSRDFRDMITAKQYAMYAKTLKDATVTMQAAFDRVGQAGSITIEVQYTQYERLMREKRSRPAPPGTGIDHRKRKL